MAIQKEPTPPCFSTYPGPDLIPVLTSIEGLKHLKAPDSAQAFLKKNGFVVVPRYYRQIFSPYIHESELPPFITTDSLFATFHIIFENQVKIVEADFASEIREFTAEMLAETGGAGSGSGGAGSCSSGSRSGKAEVTGSQSTGNGEADSRTAGSQFAGSGAAGSQTTGSQAAGSQTAGNQLAASISFDKSERDSRLMCTAYFSVAARLLDDSFMPEVKVKKIVSREVELIMGGSGVAQSPLFGYCIDYSQFSPRGFYTDSDALKRYFRAMSWYGSCAFRLISDRETEAAILMAGALARNKKACVIWKKMDGIYSALLTPSDDITLLRYAELKKNADSTRSTAPAAASVSSPATTAAPANAPAAADRPDWLSRFKIEAQKEPEPAINSMVLTPEEMPRWKELTKGMRLFGKRYVPDSEIFMYLTYPEVPDRRMPSGLDIMAANGSERARELLEKEGAFSMAGYEKGFKKAEEVIKREKNKKNRSCYGDFLSLTETLTSQNNEKAFPFMKTEAYKDKNLMTALACWASMRHTWQLQAKPSAICACASKPPFGFVEPNMLYYEKLHQLIRHTIDVLRPLKNADIKRLEKMDALTAVIRKIAVKQGRGEALTKEEDLELFRYADTIANLSYFEGNLFYLEEMLPWMSCITDVHTDYTKGTTEALEVGRGPAMPIYVVIPFKGKHVLAVGGVLSYYQFSSPLQKRLTDDEWKKKTSAGTLPSLPAWAGSFVSGLDLEPLLKKLEEGWRVDEICYINDARIEKALEKGIKPGGAFTQCSDLKWAVEMYGKKAGRKAVPLMLEYLRRGMSGGLSDKESAFDGMNVSSAAARALCLTAGPEEVPALCGIMRSGDKERIDMAVKILSSIGGDSARKALYDAYKISDDEMICDIFRDCQLKSSTPLLLESFRKNPQEDIIYALDTIWRSEDCRHESDASAVLALTDDITADREKILRKEVEKLILANIPSENQKLSDAAVCAAGNLKLYKALPLIKKQAEKSNDLFYIIHALGKLKCEDSCRILIELAAKADNCEKSGIISSLKELGNSKCLPLLKVFLSDRGDAGSSDMLVCDHAARALQQFYTSGPVWKEDRYHSHTVTRQEMDDYVKRWKKYLEGRPR